MVLGAQWVAEHADQALATAASDLIAKIAVAVPKTLRPLIDDSAARTPPAWSMAADGLDIASARAWARQGRKIRLVYRDRHGATSQRTIWPVAVAHFDAARILVGWCELRAGFRDFRADRVVEAAFLEERFPGSPPPCSAVAG